MILKQKGIDKPLKTQHKQQIIIDQTSGNKPLELKYTLKMILNHEETYININ